MKNILNKFDNLYSYYKYKNVIFLTDINNIYYENLILEYLDIKKIINKFK
jgi:hypothetical protein